MCVFLLHLVQPALDKAASQTTSNTQGVLEAEAVQVQRSFTVSALGSNQLSVQYMDPMQTLALAGDANNEPYLFHVV